MISSLYHLICTPTIAFPVFSVEGQAQAMAAHRLVFTTPRGGGGKNGPEGDAARVPDVVGVQIR